MSKIGDELQPLLRTIIERDVLFNNKQKIESILQKDIDTLLSSISDITEYKFEINDYDDNTAFYATLYFRTVDSNVTNSWNQLDIAVRQQPDTFISK